MNRVIQTMTLDYRKATDADIPAMMQLGVHAYATHAATLGPEHWAKMEANLASRAYYEGLMQRATGFLCTSGDTMAGMVFLVPSGEPSQHFPDEWAHLRTLGVAPEFHGMGIARKLMELCIYEATSLGETTLALHTGAFMHAARKLYATLGFRIDQELVPLFDQQYTRFRLDLGGCE